MDMKTLAIMLVAGFALVSCSSHKDSRKVPHKDYYYDQQVKSLKEILSKAAGYFRQGLKKMLSGWLWIPQGSARLTGNSMTEYTINLLQAVSVFRMIWRQNRLQSCHLRWL